MKIYILTIASGDKEYLEALRRGRELDGQTFSEVLEYEVEP